MKLRVAEGYKQAMSEANLPATSRAITAIAAIAATLILAMAPPALAQAEPPPAEPIPVVPVVPYVPGMPGDLPMPVRAPASNAPHAAPAKPARVKARPTSRAARRAARRAAQRAAWRAAYVRRATQRSKRYRGYGTQVAEAQTSRGPSGWRPSWWPRWLPAGSGKAAVVVSISRNRAYLHDGYRLWSHFPVATGRDYATPRGSYRIVSKVLSPSWTYKDKHVPGGAWGNPLGVAWLGLGMPASWGRYPIGIHGTNAPWSIGYRVSKGCIRMQNRDVLKVYRSVPVGSPVWIVW